MSEPMQYLPKVSEETVYGVSGELHARDGAATRWIDALARDQKPLAALVVEYLKQNYPGEGQTEAGIAAMGLTARIIASQREADRLGAEFAEGTLLENDADRTAKPSEIDWASRFVGSRFNNYEKEVVGLATLCLRAS